jgi:proteasome lid subunit RPN8/RPN11
MSSLDVRAIDEKDLRREPCPAMRQEYRVFLSEQAFDRAVARGESDTTREIGGVLVGELLRDDHGPYLRIEDTIDALHAEEKGAELTFTHATWEHIHKQMDSRHKGKRVVGWYHTHPGFGVFLSDRDQFIHKSFFDLPFQVAFVYDPKAKEHGMFTWRDHEIQRTRRYWIGAREQVWDGPRTAGAPAGRDKDGGKDRDRDRDRAAADRDGPGDREDRERAARAADAELRDEGPGGLATFIGIALVLVLIAGFIGHWLGAGSANQALAQAQIDVARVRAEAAQSAIGSLQVELVGLLRETLGDQALHKPAAGAIAELDKAIAALQPPAAGSGSAGSGGAAAAAPAVNAEQALAQLQAARAGLVRLLEDRGTAETVLAELERAARRGSTARADLSRDVAEQRAGLGSLYAELAADAAKAGDAGRARRLLAAAAHLDPGNRPRYERQLQTFDKSGTLPQITDPSAGPAGAGDKR